MFPEAPIPKLGDIAALQRLGGDLGPLMMDYTHRDIEGNARSFLKGAIHVRW